MVVIPSITTLQGQLEEDAKKLGISVINMNKVRQITFISSLTTNEYLTLGIIAIEHC